MSEFFCTFFFGWNFESIPIDDRIFLFCFFGDKYRQIFIFYLFVFVVQKKVCCSCCCCCWDFDGKFLFIGKIHVCLIFFGFFLLLFGCFKAQKKKLEIIYLFVLSLQQQVLFRFIPGNHHWWWWTRTIKKIEIPFNLPGWWFWVTNDNVQHCHQHHPVTTLFVESAEMVDWVLFKFFVFHWKFVHFSFFCYPIKMDVNRARLFLLVVHRSFPFSSVIWKLFNWWWWYCQPRITIYMNQCVPNTCVVCSVHIHTLFVLIPQVAFVTFYLSLVSHTRTCTPEKCL